MSTIRGTTELGPLTARRQVYSPLEPYWDAFQEWRKRQTLLAKLCALSDRELMDIGIARSEIAYLASHRGCDARGALSGGQGTTMAGSQDDGSVLSCPPAAFGCDR
ncbi:DUF1127 domain-containing protein [Bradyrhizobium arachidis]|uniref:DUF1127 domain-containing protein n=1 Tax=Bradyrhizobium arachidis TaxID=858423 RepID=A0AAE7NPU5_9BRAD|nr:DUF1127 domain-containing protein [Bradyrhizobium arachidis]QOZ69823.1 DUF1127 domain-containing protein [Bradyrhizobium arachidis]SFV18433.1 protein of unknown function [Bradyrhizobium arachidis]